MKSKEIDSKDKESSDSNEEEEVESPVVDKNDKKKEQPVDK